ncbi:MAG: hypothetical protein NT031_15660 [Planctomycetota bacterium]|nr:hypothetical protein [Planctomycetota bacterium]
MAKKEHHVILGVHITDRLKKAALVQSLLSKYGSHIRTRVGLHDVTGKSGSPNGVVLLEMVGAMTHSDALAAKLGAIPGVEVQRIVFTH